MWSDKSTIFTCFLLPSPWTHSVCTLCDVCFCFCAISWSMWLLHRLRGNPLVPGPRAAGGRHSVRTSGGRLGDRMRVRWAAVGDPSLAREVWHGPTVPDQEDSRWERPAAEGKHSHIFSWKIKEKWAWFTKQCVTLVFLVLRRRSDPSTSAGLQQQPVLLWSFRPRATGDGETHRTLRLHASSLHHVKSKTSLKRLSFLSVGTFGAEISKSVASSSESHEGKDVTCSLMEILFLHQRQRINLKQNTHERLRSNLNVHVLLHFFYRLKKCL